MTDAGAHSIFRKKLARHAKEISLPLDVIGAQLPPAAAEAKPHPRPKATAARFTRYWHTVNLRSAASSAIIRTSEHFHVFSPPPRLSVRMFGSGGKKRANASSNCAAL